LNDRWTLEGGIGVERTELQANSTTYTYPAAASASLTVVPALRTLVNVAPETALLYRPNRTWKFHARLGTGYGTPQASNLFVTPDGVSGNNTQLESQTNVGLDLGAEWAFGNRLNGSLTGFYERFRNELVSQSPGANLLSYTFNAPASTHRGIEAALDWHPLPSALAGAHLAASYSLDDQRYTEYTERLSAGNLSAAFDRKGNRIPGVTPNYLNLRLAYDHPTGPAGGVGAFVEFNARDSAFMDNANLVKAPSYKLVHLNVHFDPHFDGKDSLSPHLFFEVRNLTNRVYVASASNISDSINATTGLQNPASVLFNSGSIWAGAPRTFSGGVRMRF
jgi:iron complex outermembrane receptor protein